ncbi:sigma-70 family RNA polymerase sigma factor [Kribbella qitaiheensis]|uniref:Sigma-70 family RNA polymerase sigma factor n=2 Tax=Kribbella qitaiheensis TaxID=1544730 RepID=A0A7G6X9E6_9ACTN|nr:sigma-70 family RNA polymerase sigma factor [Kribbella qitaiheensis]
MHYRAVLRYVVRRHGDVEDARDVTAEVFLVAWQRRADLPADRALPWLYGVAAKVLSDRYRSAERADRAYRRAGNDLATQTAAGPEDRAEWSQELSQVVAVLGTLSTADQEVLMLHAWEELRGKDLAAALGCSTAAAAVRLHRARRRLTAARIARSKSSVTSGSTVVASAQSETLGDNS